MSNIINGDGNVVGNDNRIVVDKRVINKQQYFNGGGGRTPKSNGNDASAFWGLTVAFLVAVIVATWKFTLYASVIYAICKVSVLLLSILCLMILIILYDTQPLDWLIKQFLLLASLGIAAVAVWISAETYPIKLTEIASTAYSWKDFWCHLSDERGKPLSVYYMFSVCFLIVPALLLTAISTIGAVLRSLYVHTGVIWFGRYAMIQTSTITYITLTFALLSFLAQLDIFQAEFNALFINFNQGSNHLFCV
jgi:hypothetical protein